MPTSKDWFERLIRVEEKVKNIMTFQKWQMGILAAIFLAALRAAIR